MRKAFEDNVPRRRPRLRRAAVEGLAPGAPGAAQPVALVSRPAAPPPQAAGDTSGRHERLEKIKRKVAAIAPPPLRIELEKIRRRAARPALSVGPLPAVPARAPDNVLSLVEALRAELARARQREEALRAELARTRQREEALRSELARAGGEARGAAERLAAAYADYLFQVAVRQRTQFARTSGQGRPVAVLGGVSREAAECDEAAGDHRTDPQGGLRRRRGLNQSPQCTLSDPKPQHRYEPDRRFRGLPISASPARGSG